MSNEDRINILKEKREKINSISPSFCSAKWLQTTLYLQNGYNHSCHHPSPHKIPIPEVVANPSALSNSKQKKEARKEMLAGIRPKECDYCWKIEDLNKDYFSDRHYKTSDYWSWDRIDEVKDAPWDADVYPSYLEVSFSNACNFKCSYCSPEISSKWLEEIKQFGPYPTTGSSHDLEWLKQGGRYPYKHSEPNPYVHAFWKWFPEAYKHLKVFRITGGEPLMSKDTWKVLEYIKQNPKADLEVAINSNLCVEDKLIDKLIVYLNELREVVGNVRLFTSLESTGEQAEYSRFGLDYEKWKSNMDRVLTETKVRITIMTTINILSLPTMTDFIELIMQYRTKYNEKASLNRVPISFNFLRWPAHLDVKILPESMRKNYSNQILQLANKYLIPDVGNDVARVYLEEFDQIKRFCDYLITNPGDVNKQQKDFVKFINEYDRRRLLSFEEVFPELSSLLEIWK